MKRTLAVGERWFNELQRRAHRSPSYWWTRFTMWLYWFFRSKG